VFLPLLIFPWYSLLVLFWHRLTQGRKTVVVCGGVSSFVILKQIQKFFFNLYSKTSYTLAIDKATEEMDGKK